MITLQTAAESATSRVFRLATGFTLGEDTDGTPILGGGGGGGTSSPAVAGEAFPANTVVYIDSIGKVRRAAADVAGLIPVLLMATTASAGVDSIVTVTPLDGRFVTVTTGFTLGQAVWLNTGTGTQFTAAAPTAAATTVILLGKVVKTTTAGAMAIAFNPTFMYVNG